MLTEISLIAVGIVIGLFVAMAVESATITQTRPKINVPAFVDTLSYSVQFIKKSDGSYWVECWQKSEPKPTLLIAGNLSAPL